MKRKALIKDLVKSGCYLKRHGSKHDIYANPRTGRQTPIPRHPEMITRRRFLQTTKLLARLRTRLRPV